MAKKPDAHLKALRKMQNYITKQESKDIIFQAESKQQKQVTIK